MKIDMAGVIKLIFPASLIHHNSYGQAGCDNDDGYGETSRVLWYPQ